MKKLMNKAKRVMSTLKMAHLFGIGKLTGPAQSVAVEAPKKADLSALPAAPSRNDTAPSPRARSIAPKARPTPASVARDEDSEDELLDDGAMAAARQRERARCQAILGCEAAATNRTLAHKLAFTTRMTRTEAIAMLQLAPACPEPDRYNQARADRNPRVGSPTSDAPPAREAAASRMHATLAAEMQRTRVAGPVASAKGSA